MISKRLLNKLQEGKKYLITDGIGFYLLEKEEDRIWCSDLDRSSGSFFSIYMKSWRDVLFENRDDNEFFYKVKYHYNQTQPTYKYTAFITKMFLAGSVDFSTCDLFFLGEYKEDTDIKEIKRYCNLYGITYKWENKKQRRKLIYRQKQQN